MEVRINKITREDMIAHMDKVAEEARKWDPEIKKEHLMNALDGIMKVLDGHGFDEEINEMGEGLSREAKWHVSEETDTEYVLTIDSYEGDADEVCEWIKKAMTQMIEFEAYENMVGGYPALADVE